MPCSASQNSGEMEVTQTQTRNCRGNLWGPHQLSQDGPSVVQPWALGACYPEPPRADCQPRICCDNV